VIPALQLRAAPYLVNLTSLCTLQIVVFDSYTGFVFNFLPCCFYSEPQLFFCYINCTNCEYSCQISAVKKNIETVQGVDVYPAAQQMLIHQGKVLKDGTTLEENKVAENSFIVIMLSKVKLSFISFSVSKTTLILNLL